MKTKNRNENGKITLWLGRDFGSNMKVAGEFDTLKELKKEGKRLLKEGTECANGLPSREYAYFNNKGVLTFCW